MRLVDDGWTAELHLKEILAGVKAVAISGDYSSDKIVLLSIGWEDQVLLLWLDKCGPSECLLPWAVYMD